MQLPNPLKQANTQGVEYHKNFEDHLGDLWFEVVKQFKKQPNGCTGGGNDKFFFVFTFENVRLFVAHNDVGGLTIMLPGEY